MRATVVGRSSTGRRAGAVAGAVPGEEGRRRRGSPRSQIEVGSVPTPAPRGRVAVSIEPRPPGTSWDNPAVTGPVIPSAEEIRALVRRVVSDVLAGSAPALAASGPPAGGAPVAPAAPGGPGPGGGGGRTIGI